MTNFEPDLGIEDLDYCEECEEEFTGYPAVRPPCTKDTCGNQYLNLDQSEGSLASQPRIRGGVHEQLEVTDDNSDCGLIRCIHDSDGGWLGLDIPLTGKPATITELDCVDPETGDSRYVNPVRKILDENGNCTLGSLPFPYSDEQCETLTGCDAFYPAPSSLQSEVYENCGPDLCATITNDGCYPMRVKPKLTVVGAEIEGPATIEYQPNINGEFQSKFKLTAGLGMRCEETSSAGSGATSESGSGETVAGGDPSHTHDIPVHTHDGPSHEHDVTCEIIGTLPYTGTTEFKSVIIQPGETFSYCLTGSVRFNDTTWDQGGVINYGDICLCIEGQSVVNATTIAALEGN